MDSRSKRVDGTRFNNRLVGDLKKDLASNFLSWMASLVNRDEKGGKAMKKFCRGAKAFIGSCIRAVVAFCKRNKKTIARLAGMLVIYVCKTIIESIIDDLL